MRSARRTSPVLGRCLALFAATGLLWCTFTTPAVAHVSVAPDTVPPETFTTYTFTVPNEEKAEATIGLDVTVPPGFLLETAEAAPGWTTKVDTRPDGSAGAIHWSGGRLPPHTFAEFAIRGRVGKQPGLLAFPVLQRYETSTVSWTGLPDSDRPAPALTVSDTAASPEQVRGAPASPSTVAGPPQVPPAAETTATTSQGQDDLARSRASLALVLAGAALLIPITTAGMAVLRKRASG